MPPRYLLVRAHPIRPRPMDVDLFMSVCGTTSSAASETGAGYVGHIDNLVGRRLQQYLRGSSPQT